MRDFSWLGKALGVIHADSVSVTQQDIGIPDAEYPDDFYGILF